MKVIICTWRIREWELQILNWSSSVQPEIVPLFTISFQCLKKKFKSWQVYDWLAKWLIMSGYMDLRRPRVYRRSNVGLVITIFFNQNPILVTFLSGRNCDAYERKDMYFDIILTDKSTRSVILLFSNDILGHIQQRGESRCDEPLAIMLFTLFS